MTTPAHEQGPSRFERLVDVIYPAGMGEVRLRVGHAEDCWEGEVPDIGGGASLPEELVADELREGGTCHRFRVCGRRPFLYVQAVLHRMGGEVRVSPKRSLVLLTAHLPRALYPAFSTDLTGELTDLNRVRSAVLGRRVRLRVYVPPGYGENTLKRYPVLYMYDGANLFLPDEAFLGREWQVDETLDRLDATSALDKVLVVGIYAGPDREKETTGEGIQAFGRAMVEEIKPWVDGHFRTLRGPRDTAVMGSSLGGVAAFSLAWEHPEVFGAAACLSSTFDWRDDLIDQVLTRPRRPVRFYLDSGWPGDNYEVTRAMAAALKERGYQPGCDYLHLVFPEAGHDENAWGERLHLPFQFLFGRSMGQPG